MDMQSDISLHNSNLSLFSTFFITFANCIKTIENLYIFVCILCMKKKLEIKKGQSILYITGN